MSVINQKEYLKKYLGIGKGSGEKKKKKKKTKPKQTSNGLKIVDDDDFDVKLNQEIQVDLTADNEEAPQIVSIIDDRPPSLRIDEATQNKLWQPIGAPESAANENKSLKFEGVMKFSKSEVGQKSSKRKNKYEFGASSSLNLTIKKEVDSNDEDNNDVSPLRKVGRLTTSPSRKIKREKSEDNTPPRRNKASNIDSSPPRKSRREKSEDSSPPRKNKTTDIDSSPPRRRRRHSDDFSPPRKSKREKSEDSFPSRRNKTSDIDSSPPRKSRREKSEDNSPSRRNKTSNIDSSPPRRRRRYSDDFSPPRKSKREKSEDSSPPRRNKTSDVNSSPPRRSRRHSDDMSPPRKSEKREEDDDISPPRKSKTRRNDDRSPARQRTRRGDSADKSPPRKANSLTSRTTTSHKRNQKETLKKSRWGTPEVDEKTAKTLDGKKAGLQNATDLAYEMYKLKKREEELFKNMRPEVSGANAATVVRGKKQQVNWEEEEARRKKEKENKEKYDRWGKGLKQVEDINEKMKNELYEMSKPLARYADDEDLEKYLKEQERDGDPMLAYLRKKKKKQAIEEGKPVTKQYEGDAPPNRFGIRPGYRWDGVDRSNGYEKQWFQVQNSRMATVEESYKWSIEDM